MPFNCLAIETATSACSVALQLGEEIIEKHHTVAREHNKVLLKNIEAVLAEGQVSLSELDAITVGVGPGSFVGVRIAVGVVQGMAFGADLPVVPLSTLQVLAQTAYQEHQVEFAAVSLDARKDDMYLGCYQLQNGIMTLVGEEDALPPECIALPEAKQKWQAIGDGWRSYTNRLPELPACQFDEALFLLLPHAKAMLPIAEAQLNAGLTQAPEDVLPVYLRGTRPWE